MTHRGKQAPGRKLRVLLGVVIIAVFVGGASAVMPATAGFVDRAGLTTAFSTEARIEIARFSGTTYAVRGGAAARSAVSSTGWVPSDAPPIPVKTIFGSLTDIMVSDGTTVMVSVSGGPWTTVTSPGMPIRKIVGAYRNLYYAGPTLWLVTDGTQWKSSTNNGSTWTAGATLCGVAGRTDITSYSSSGTWSVYSNGVTTWTCQSSSETVRANAPSGITSLGYSYNSIVAQTPTGWWSSTNNAGSWALDATLNAAVPGEQVVGGGDSADVVVVGGWSTAFYRYTVTTRTLVALDIPPV